ncbi:MAG: AMP-binding protein, partial [Microbacteriaceae bacterium]|nr:AMP-binding protein [Microbacteriaceae bacterium]
MNPTPFDLDALDPEEQMSREELEALQLERLKWTVAHAYENVPMYTKKFDEAGVSPDDLQTLADLAKFPFTTKEDLRQNYPFKTFAVPMTEVRRIHASSGTTGRPTVVGYTDADIDKWAQAVARVLRLSGARKGDLVHNAYGYGLFTGGIGAHYGVERAGLTVIPMSGGQTDRQIQLIHDFEPRIIMSTPSYLLTILDKMRQEGIDAAATSLEIAILGAEPWTEEMRQEIEQGFGITAVDIYGLSELMGPGVAGESAEHKNGSTIWEDMFLPEIVDADD